MTDAGPGSDDDIPTDTPTDALSPASVVVDDASPADPPPPDGPDPVGAADGVDEDRQVRVRAGLGILAIVVALAALVALVVGDDGDEGATTGGRSTTTTSEATTEPAGTATRVEATPTAPPTSAAPCDPAALVAQLPLRRRLAALVVTGVDPSTTQDALEVVGHDPVGGLFIGGNDTTLLTSGVLQDLRADAPGLMVMVDEEGGRVQRIEGIDGDVPSAREMAATMTPAEVRDLARRRGRVMREHGVTVDLAPVVDVSAQDDGEVIGDRSFSDDPETVVAYARAYAEGLLDEGVTPVLKHFPGHGSSSGDTHEGAASTPPIDELRSSDLVPYAELLPLLGERSGVMLGHLDVPGLTEDGLPASVSPATVRLLRDDYGFQGVIMTDDLGSMAAVTGRFSPGEAAERALAAGVDMVLFAAVDVPGLLDHLEAAVGDGRLDAATIDAAVVRTLRLKGIDPCAAAG